MYYIILTLLGAIILFVGWPRSQDMRGNPFNIELVESRIDQLTRNLSSLEKRLISIEQNMINGGLISPSAVPLSEKGLTSYHAIQQDWRDGSSLPDICQRYQLLQGEVELILDLMEGVSANESRNLHSFHSDGSQQGRSGNESGKSS